VNTTPHLCTYFFHQILITTIVFIKKIAKKIKQLFFVNFKLLWKFVPLRDIMAYREECKLTLFILNLDNRWRSMFIITRQYVYTKEM